MRHLLLVLMIALLPLRGWASESMAVSMAVQQLGVVQEQTSGNAAMPVDCPFFGQAFKVPSIDTTGDTNADTITDTATDTFGETLSPLCKGCTTCQLCMALVTGFAPTPAAATPLPHAKRLAINASFTSAERAPGYKPPIS